MGVSTRTPDALNTIMAGGGATEVRVAIDAAARGCDALLLEPDAN